MDDIKDANDKTIIRPRPGASSHEQTVIRPQPGLKRHNQQPAAVPGNSYNQPVRETTSAPSQIEAVIANNETEQLSDNSNPVISCATTLLTVFAKLKNTISHNDVAGLYQRLVNEVQLFEKNSKLKMIRPEIILASRYTLCAALDEVVMNTPWGATSNWSTHTLLTTFHNESSGGEKFYLLLDRMKQNARENIDILELLFYILSLGFEGKYRVVNNGRDHVEIIRNDLYQVIRSVRGEPERDLMMGEKPQNDSRSTLARYMPLWVVASIFGAVMLVSFIGFRFWLNSTTDGINQKLTRIENVITEEITRQNTSSGMSVK